MSEEQENPIEQKQLKSRLNAQYALAICYLLIAVLIIVASFAIPNINSASMITFALLGFFLFIAALVQIFAVPTLACKPPPGSEE